MNKDDDLNEDFEPVNDPAVDSDFGEFDQEMEKGSFSDLVKKNPAIKIGMIVAALLVVVGGITLFGGKKTKAPDSVVASGNDLKEVPGTKELSPAMKEVIDEVNNTNVENALKTGGSVIPQPTEVPKQTLTVPAEDTAAEDPLMRWRQMQNERLEAQKAEQAQQTEAPDPQKQQAQQAITAAITAQMNQILGVKKTVEMKSMKVTSLEEILQARQKMLGGQQQQGAQTAGMANAATTQSGIDPLTGEALKPAKILLPAGAIEYGQLLIEANSDIKGPIIALIVSGPFAGSRVLGDFTAQEDYLVLKFSNLVDKKGVSIPIQAFAIDPDTTLTGMATDVDHRYWERIILPAAADFVEGMGEAYADKQGQTTVVTGDVVVQDEPSLHTKEQIASGVEKAAERVSDILAEQGDNTQPLIRVRAGTPLGILFMSPITDQDRLASQTNPTTARSQAQQQQQSFLQQQMQGAQPQSPLYLIQGLQGAQNMQATQGSTGASGTMTGFPSSTGYSSSSTTSQGSVSSNNSLNP